MRLWHYELIPYLPGLQLLAQWRELNSIFKKQNKHILINYVHEYPKDDLYAYTSLVIRELRARHVNFKFSCNFSNYFDFDFIIRFSEKRSSDSIGLFSNYHTDRYLLQCFYNLQEKYDRGQKGFTEEIYNRLEGFVDGKLHKD